MNRFVGVARVSSLFASLLAVVGLLSGCGTLSSGHQGGPTGNPGDDGPGRLSTDELRPGEIVIVTFSGASEPPPRHEDRIREDGYITLPFVGAVKAGGKTRAQLQREITDLFVPKLYRQLTVTVNSDTRFFTVDGEVRTPTRIIYQGRSTVLKAIAAAGGFTDFANQKKVQIIRSNGKKERVDCVKARTNPQLDIEIFPDDYIYVPRRFF